MVKKIGQAIISLAVLLGLWQLAVSLLHTPAYVLPGPGAVWHALTQDAAPLLRHAQVTLGETLIGLGVACLVALITGLAMAWWQGLYHALFPLLVVSQTLPVIVLGPLLTLWFGFELWPKIILVVLMSYFPIIVAFVDALKVQDREQTLLFETMGASKWQLYRYLRLPRGMQGYLSGLKVAATYSMGGAIIGEWLSAEAGLGYYMIRAKNAFAINKVFAAIAVIIALSLLLNGLATLAQSLFNRLVLKEELS